MKNKLVFLVMMTMIFCLFAGMASASIVVYTLDDLSNFSSAGVTSSDGYIYPSGSGYEYYNHYAVSLDSFNYTTVFYFETLRASSQDQWLCGITNVTTLTAGTDIYYSLTDDVGNTGTNQWDIREHAGGVQVYAEQFIGVEPVTSFNLEYCVWFKIELDETAGAKYYYQTEGNATYNGCSDTVPSGTWNLLFDSTDTGNNTGITLPTGDLRMTCGAYGQNSGHRTYAMAYEPPCVENWTQSGTMSCDGLISNYTITYTDQNSCGTIASLPADNGTVVDCCVESWVAGWVESGCPISGFHTKVYSDTNSCNTTYQLPASNGTAVVCLVQSGGGSGGGAKPSAVATVEPLAVVEEELAEVGTSEGALTGLKQFLSRFWDWLTFWN